MARPARRLLTKNQWTMDEMRQRLGAHMRGASPDRAAAEAALGRAIPDETWHRIAMAPLSMSSNLIAAHDSMPVRDASMALRKRLKLAQALRELLKSDAPKLLGAASSAILVGDLDHHRERLPRLRDAHRGLIAALQTFIVEVEDAVHDVDTVKPGIGFVSAFAEGDEEGHAYRFKVDAILWALEDARLPHAAGSDASPSPAERLIHAVLPRRPGCEIGETVKAVRYVIRRRRKERRQQAEASRD